MESSSVTIPRWTPNPSPSGSLRKEPVPSAVFDDIEMQSIASGEEDGRSTSTMDKTFPFSSIADFGRPHLEIHEASSLRFGSEVTKSLGTDSTEEENYFACNNVGFMSSNREGFFLTWKELLVSVPDGKGGRRPILQGLTGYAEPGKMLAIMGPSGCGKSTLLDSLAGNLFSVQKCLACFLLKNKKNKGVAFHDYF